MYTLGVLSKDPNRAQVTRDIINIAGPANTQYLPSRVYTRESGAKSSGNITWLVDVSKEVMDRISLPKEYAWEISNHVATMKRLIVERVCPGSTVEQVEDRLVTIRKRAVRSAFQAGPIGSAASSSNIYQGRPYRTFTGEDDRNTAGQQRDRMMSDGYRNQTFIRPGRKSNSSEAARKMDKLNRNKRDLSKGDRDILEAKKVMGDVYTALQMKPSVKALRLFASYRNSTINMQKKEEAMAACMFSTLKESPGRPLKLINGEQKRPSIQPTRIFVVVNSGDPVLRDLPWGMMFADPPRKRTPDVIRKRVNKRKRELMSRHLGVPVYY